MGGPRAGQHTIDHQWFEVRPPVLFFIRREQVHHWNLQSEPEGYVLILKKDFFDQSTDKELHLLLSKLSSLTGVQLSDHETIENLLCLMHHECNSRNNYKRPIIEGLLKALFAKTLTIPSSDRKRPNTTNDTFYAFQELLTN